MSPFRQIGRPVSPVPANDRIEANFDLQAPPLHVRLPRALQSIRQQRSELANAPILVVQPGPYRSTAVHGRLQ